METERKVNGIVFIFAAIGGLVSIVTALFCLSLVIETHNRSKLKPKDPDEARWFYK